MERRFLLLIVGLSLFNARVVAQQSGDDRLRSLVARGYERMRTNPPEAMALFQEAVSLEPDNVAIRKELGSLYIRAGRLRDALIQFSVADHLLPSDSTKLQVAYLLNSMGLNGESYGVFSGLSRSSNRSVGRISQNALAVLGPDLLAHQYPWWGRISATPYYDSRFDNTTLSAALDIGYALTRMRSVSLLGTARLTRDTRSTGGAQPVLFSDNYFLVSAGLRFEPVDGLSAEILGGAALDLDSRQNREKLRGDFRAILTHGVGVYSAASFPEKITFAFTPWADTYSSVGYYTRYENVIGFSQARLGASVLEADLTSLSVYLRGNFGWDSAREFYNNIAEVGAGIRIVPDYSWGVALLAEIHRGTYWDRSLPTAGRNRWYDSVRIFLILDRFINF